MKLFNEKLTALRRALYHEATDLMAKQILKGTRWLLLKSAENLDDTKDEKRKLEEALALNQPQAVAYYLKEELRQFWEQSSKELAIALLDGWIQRAAASGITILKGLPRPWRRTGVGC